MPFHDRPSPFEEQLTRWFSMALVGLFGVAGFLMVVLVAGALLMPPLVQSVVESYTDERPAFVPPPPAPEEERKAIEERVDAFLAQVKEPDRGRAPAADAPAPRPVETLVLTEAELNTLLSEAIRKEKPEASLRLRLGEDVVYADLSLPIDQNIDLGPFRPELRGRYLNGTATLRLELNGGVLGVRLDTFEVKGAELPSWILSQIRKEAQLDAIVEDKDVREVMSRMRRIDVVPGRVILSAAS